MGMFFGTSPYLPRAVFFPLPSFVVEPRGPWFNTHSRALTGLASCWVSDVEVSKPPSCFEVPVDQETLPLQKESISACTFLHDTSQQTAITHWLRKHLVEYLFFLFSKSALGTAVPTLPTQVSDPKREIGKYQLTKWCFRLNVCVPPYIHML